MNKNFFFFWQKSFSFLNVLSFQLDKTSATIFQHSYACQIIRFSRPFKIHFFSIQLLRSAQNAYHLAIFWGSETDNSRWGPCLENTVDVEAIRNPIHAFLSVQCSMCEIMHCHHEKGFFSPSNVTVSSWFRQLIDPIMLHVHNYSISITKKY